ncbi:MAG: hypothetical protein HY038_13440, partial [Nitrospirae bacterium]|nr:hypothetical protein [Nitrospirota bacterium]
GGTGKVIRFDKNGKGLQVVAEISRPEGLAFDANSDLFVSAESGIYLIPGGRPISRPQQVISYKFDLVGGLAFLTQGTYQGDLVAVEEGKDVVVRFPRNAASSSFGGPVTFAKTGLDHPIGIAINSSGDVFVANFESSAILQFGPEGTSKGRLGASVDLRLFRPIHIEFDGADNLFIAEWGDLAGDGFVAMVTPSSQLRFLGSFVDAWGVALCPSE